MEDLNNIWNDEDELNEEQLINYINGKSTEEEQHDVEKQINNSSLINDGVEGLQQFSSTGKMHSYVQQINMQLKQQLNSKKKNKNRFYPTNTSWQIIAVVVIIVLCLIGYVIIEMMRK